MSYPPSRSLTNTSADASNMQDTRRGSSSDGEKRSFSRSNPFASPVSENPFAGPFDDSEEDLNTIPVIPGPVSRSKPPLSSPSRLRPGLSPSASTSRRMVTPSSSRYLSPYATPGASRRSSMASRRNSVSTDTSQHDLFWTGRKDGPYAYEHEAGSSSEINTQTVTEKFDIGPTTSLLWDPTYVEDDDDLHNPNVDNPLRDTDIWTKRGFVNLGGLVAITIALLFVFIGLPIITFAGSKDTTCTGDSCLKDGSRVLLNKPRTNMIDSDTPSSALTKTDASGNKLNLVFSDEFNTDGRTFYPGDDQFFEAKDLWYWPTQDLEWYDPDAVTTTGGYLQIQLDAFQNHGMNYRSGMLQSWNLLCFKGGMLEVSVQMPGKGSASGLWPAAWTMGNLGRPGYGATTDGMWPYSYQGCDVGITPNQSRTDGLNWLPGMRLPSCVCDSTESAGTMGYGRSSPEIDIFEASVAAVTSGANVGTVSQSYQIAPFDDFYKPNYDFVEIYNYSVTSMNVYTGGPYQQALSGTSVLNNDWYQTPPSGSSEFQTYAFEYVPGSSSSSYIQWYVGDEAVWKVEPAAIGPNGNTGQRSISEEPMTLVFNLAISTSFAYIDWTELEFPSIMKIDYVRIYQSGTASLTCDPVGWETTQYIADHPEAYTNVNMTLWEDAGYTKPTNSFMNSC